MRVTGIIGVWSTSVAISLALGSTAQAVELRVFGLGTAPSTVHLQRTQGESLRQASMDANLLWQAGAELTWASEAMPMRYGFGASYRAPSEAGTVQLSPATLPLWATFYLGVQDEDRFLSPYFAARGAWAAPLTQDEEWWARPRNAFLEAGIGAWTLYGLALEVTYDYSYLLKRWANLGEQVSVSSNRIGATVSWGIGLGMERSFRPTGGPSELEEEPL